MKPGITMTEFYRKRAGRIVIPVVVWTIIYSIYNTLTSVTGPNTWTDYAMKTLTDFSYMFVNFSKYAGHLWYVYMLLGLYLIIPIISPWVERASRKEMRLMMGVWMVASLVPFAHLIWPEMWGECDWNPYGAHWYVSGFVGYLLAGAYARKHLFDDGKNYVGKGIALIVLGYLLMLSGMLYNMYLNPPTAETYATYLNLPFEITWFFCALPNFLQTCGIFLVLFKVSKPLPVVASHFSRLSYGVYLGHIIFLGLFYNHVFAARTWPTPIKIVSLCVCAVVSTYAVIKSLSYLPKSKWIVG